MKLRKDGAQDGRKGASMARKPKTGHPWKKPFEPFEKARKRAKDSEYKP